MPAGEGAAERQLRLRVMQMNELHRARRVECAMLRAENDALQAMLEAGEPLRHTTAPIIARALMRHAGDEDPDQWLYLRDAGVRGAVRSRRRRGRQRAGGRGGGSPEVEGIRIVVRDVERLRVARRRTGCSRFFLPFFSFFRIFSSFFRVLFRFKIYIDFHRFLVSFWEVFAP